MRNTALFLSLLVLPATTVEQAARPGVAHQKTSIDSLVNALSAKDEFSGTILVARGNDVIYQRAVGVANRETNAAMRLDPSE